MEFKIECPWCNQHYSVDESFIGQKVECSVCEKEFIVGKPNISVQPISSTSSNTKETEVAFSHTATTAVSKNKSMDFFSKQNNQSNVSPDYTPEKNGGFPERSNRNFFFLIVFLVLIFLCFVFYYKNIVYEKEYKNNVNTYAGHRSEEEKQRNALKNNKSNEADEIDKVIEQVNSIEEWEVFAGFTGYSDNEKIINALRRIIGKMKAINVSRCPQEFRAAYEHCIQSYERLYDLTWNVSNNQTLRNKRNLREWENDLRRSAEECKRENAFSVMNLIAKKNGAKKQFSTLMLNNGYDLMITFMIAEKNIEANTW